ncbi:MAG: lipoate--protein ligase family protein [Geobacteraceae bacterium]|nr:lipoate--protein ligase family protein [Geobacteraceae bacterium]
MTDSSKLWRLLDTGPLDGPSNMALDEALLSCFDPGSSLPLLRLYGWNPPAFSLGRFQKPEEVLDLERCAGAGIPVVRRVTGGGCIFHAEELTYSMVCTPGQISDIIGVKESFRRLCGFLLLAYHKIGLSPAFAVDSPQRPGSLGERTPLCFAGTEEYDILVDGRKLGGNAQRRSRGLIFQHGSIPLRPALSQARPFLRCAVPAGATSLAEEGFPLEPEALKEQLLASFQENLGISLRSSAPDSKEQEKAGLLREAKYCSDAWNLEGETP